MQTQNTHGWSTLQEGSAHYLYRPVSSMGFTNIEAMIQQLQGCQNKQIAIPEVVRVANGDIFLKEPRGLRSLQDFLKMEPTTRAKLFVAQQLVKLLENLHTFVGIPHGGLNLHCLSIDTDNKLVLGGISPTFQPLSEDLTALQTLLASIFNQPNESATLKKIQTSSIKKMRRRIKMILAEDAWDDVQADWSTAIDQTNIEESSEELPLETSATNDDVLSSMMETDSMADFDAIGNELPEPMSFTPSSEPATQETTLNDPDSEDFDWELEDDWEDVDIDGWLAKDPASLDSDTSSLDSDTSSPQTIDLRKVDRHKEIDDSQNHGLKVEQNSINTDTARDVVDTSSIQESFQEETSSTLTPDVFEEGELDDWFNESEDTMPLTQSDMLRATSDAVEEISDLEDDDEVLLFSLEKKSSSSLEDGAELNEATEVFSILSASNINIPSNKNIDNDNNDNDNETLDFLLENPENDDASLIEEAQFQNIDTLDEFTLEEPSQEIPALDDDGDFATDIFSRSSLLGTLDIPAEEVQSALKEADMSDSWFVDNPKSKSANKSTDEKQPSSSSIDSGIPKWVWAASAAVVAGGAWAALHQNDAVSPAVLIDEAQTKSVDEKAQVETEKPADKNEQDKVTTETTQTIVVTNSNDSNELNVKTDKATTETTQVVEPSTPTASKNNTAQKTVSKKKAPTRVQTKTSKQRQARKPSKKTKTAKKQKTPTVASPFASPKETAQKKTVQTVQETTVKTLPTPKKKRPLPVEAPLKEKASPPVEQSSGQESIEKKQPAPKPPAQTQTSEQVVAEPTVEVLEQVPATKAADTVERQAVTEQNQQQQETAPVEDAPNSTTDTIAEEPTPEIEVKNSKTEADAPSVDTASEPTNTKPTEEAPRPISAADYRNWSSNAVKGKLNDYSIERLKSVKVDDASFTRANSILLTHAQQSGDAKLIGNSLERLLSVETNAHKPIYLLAMAQHQFNAKNMDGAREYLMQAELNWANVERSQLMVLRAQRDNIVAHISYVSFLESGSEDSRLQSLTQFRKVQREARRAKLRSLFEQAESKMQQLQRGAV